MEPPRHYATLYAAQCGISTYRHATPYHSYCLSVLQLSYCIIQDLSARTRFARFSRIVDSLCITYVFEHHLYPLDPLNCIAPRRSGLTSHSFEELGTNNTVDSDVLRIHAGRAKHFIQQIRRIGKLKP